MPFPVRPVSPVNLSNKRVPSGVKQVDNELEFVTNQTLTQAMRQLASLLKQADSLFIDLGAHCNSINDTTARINKRVRRLTEKVDSFDPRKQKIPAGDLVTFSRLKVHYHTTYPEETNLFTNQNRTQAVESLYSKADRTGQGAEVNRGDFGFVCVPVTLDRKFRKNKMHLDITTRRPGNYEEFTRRLRHGTPIDIDSEVERLHIEKVNQDSEVVSVDISGRNFTRMTNYRRSLQPATPRKRRSRKSRGDRRNTLAGGEKINPFLGKQNRSRSHESRKVTAAGLPSSGGDLDISLDVTTGSSFATTTIPDMDLVSMSSSYANTTDKTMSDILLPPPLPELKSNAQMKKLRSMGQACSSNPFENLETETYNPFLDIEGQTSSPIFSDKDVEGENYYESLGRVRTKESLTCIGDALLSPGKAGTNPDGASSSSGVWTASASGGSDREDGPRDITNTNSELTTLRVLQQRPHSSLSLGVVDSDTESAVGGSAVCKGESSGVGVLTACPEESNNTLRGGLQAGPELLLEGEEGSIHSCDTEGYYTTFHDFDGFQEVAKELKLLSMIDMKLHIQETGDEDNNGKPQVVLRKKNGRPPPPKRQSSLFKDRDSFTSGHNRVSTDTVVHVSELQNSRDSKSSEVQNTSNDVSFEFSCTGSENEGTEHFGRLHLKTAIGTRHIPSMCVVTPSLSDDESQRNSANTSLNISRAGSETPDNKNRDSNVNNDRSNNSETALILENQAGSNCSSDSGNQETVCDKKTLDTDSNNSMLLTTSPDKVVSITPDIVKPVKGSGEFSGCSNSTEQVIGSQNSESGTSGSSSVFTSNSGSCLPDMLTNTPEIYQSQIDSTGGMVTCDKKRQPESLEIKNIERPTVCDLELYGRLPGRPSSLGQLRNTPQAASGGNKTSYRETHRVAVPAGERPQHGSSEQGGPPAVPTQPAQPVVSVSVGPQTSSEQLQPKLRITSPFSAYKKNGSSSNISAKSCRSKVESAPVPPATLLTVQGALVRNAQPPISGSDSDYSTTAAHNLTQKTLEDFELGPNIFIENNSSPKLEGRVVGMHKMSSATSVISGQIPSNGIDSRNSSQRSSLKRSDSYRRARPILSPDLSHNNRKSAEISQYNNSSNILNNSSKVSSQSSSTKTASSNNSISIPSPNTSSICKKETTVKNPSKGNFFKNIRSQFSFSSLRRKCPKTPANKTNGEAEQNNADQLKRRNSFSHPSPANKTTPEQPRMTSTPVSDCSSQVKTNSSNQRKESTKIPTLKPANEWKESPKSSSVDKPIKYRTAALKNQHQRWSFAEQDQQNQRSMNHQHFPQYNTATNGYIQAYKHHMLTGGHHNNVRATSVPCQTSQHSVYQQHIHHHPIVHHNHTLRPPGQHLNRGPPPIYHASYGPSSSNPFYGGSQRSSIASINGLIHDPACTTIKPQPTKFEKPEEGAYGYSVSGVRSFPSKVAPPHLSDIQSVERTSSQASQLPGKMCQCPMCYHSVKSPCPDCGCPSKGSVTDMSLKVNVKQRGPPFTDHQAAMAFFSPSSDYYSLSPGSPPPDDIQLQSSVQSSESPSEGPVLQTQPIYAKVNKHKPSEGQKTNEYSPVSQNLMLNKQNESTLPNDTKMRSEAVLRPQGGMHHNRSQMGPSKKPSVPERAPKERSMGPGRRHSWAGDKGPGIQKQTSLTDFKKLLAQQSMGQNPHRLSAKELLDNQSLENEIIESSKSSQKNGAGGSLRKRSSPWKEKRFSVIQEEPEGGSKENLLNYKR